MTYAFWDRKELYDLVWAQPVTKVAKQFGVSDVAIAKACRKLKVPLPGRGYWARKQNGYAVQTVPLPKAKDIPQVSKPQPRAPGERAPTDPEDQQEIDRIETCCDREHYSRRKYNLRSNIQPSFALAKKPGMRKTTGVTYSHFPKDVWIST